MLTEADDQSQMSELQVLLRIVEQMSRCCSVTKTKGGSSKDPRSTYQGVMIYFWNASGRSSTPTRSGSLTEEYFGRGMTPTDGNAAGHGCPDPSPPQ